MPTAESIAAAAREQQGADLPPISEDQIDRLAWVMKPGKADGPTRGRASDAA